MKEKILEILNKTDLTNIKQITVNFYNDDGNIWIGYLTKYNKNGQKNIRKYAIPGENLYGI